MAPTSAWRDSIGVSSGCSRLATSDDELQPGPVPARSRKADPKKFDNLPDLGSDGAMATTHAIGPFRLDVDAEILFRGSEPLPIGKRAVAVLRVLVDRAGAPVSKDALIDAAWSGLAVEDSNLTVQIAALRRVLGVEPGGDKWIETLPRRGYRFVGTVTKGTPNTPVDVPGSPSASAPITTAQPAALNHDPGDKGCDDDGAFCIGLHAGIACWVAGPVHARGAVKTAQELHELTFVLGPNSRNLRLPRWVCRGSPTRRRIGANIGLER